MGNTIYPPTVINWIDWTKVIAIFFVVLGHIPQESASVHNNNITIISFGCYVFWSNKFYCVLLLFYSIIKYHLC